MKIRTYIFDDVKEGMKKIKEEHGIDTIIVDIKNNGATASKQGCEISIAVDGDRAVQGDDLEDLRRRLEGVWDHNARYMNGKVGNMEMELIRDRVKTYPLPLRVVFDKMVKNGFEIKSALSIVSEVYCALGPLAEDSPKAGFFVKRTVTARVKVHNPILSNAPIFILGPSGAGKTETVRKLAHLSVEHALHVSILALGPSQNGAHNGLRAFSEHKGVPFAAVSGEHDLIAALDAGGTRKIVDLSGPLDLQKKMVANLTHVEKLMVLPAGIRDEKIKACCSQFKGQHLSGLVFTKLDEEETVGHIFDNLLRLSLPLSFLTTGAGEKDIVTPNSDVLYKILIEGNTWKRRDSALLQ
jgi:flagellar biosynthesis GTPase FlhF